MFTIICTLRDSQFEGSVEEVERETEYSFERTVKIYSHLGMYIYPKGVWARVDQLPVIETTPLEKYPGETH